MSFKNTPIPAAAAAAGYTRLAFSDDFDNLDTIDLKGEGKPGFNWYIDRPNGMPDMKPTDFSIPEESVLHLEPEMCRPLIGISSYSKRGDTGYTMQFGYIESRIRAKIPGPSYQRKVHCWPAFWTLSKQNIMGQPYEHLGELDIIEMVAIQGGKPIYTGTLHDWHGSPQNCATNFVNSTGYLDQFDFLDDDWHTYAALWEPGRVAWYLDNKLMHSVTYTPDDVPQYFYRDDPTPLPCPPEELGWVGAHSVMDNDPQVIIYGCRGEWPMDIDWIRVWQK